MAPANIMLPQLPLPNQNPKPLITFTLKQEPKEKLYTIKPNDNLSKIAEATHTTVERLWEKNTDLASPDLIEPNKQIKIPKDDEPLADRPLPIPPVTVPIQPTTLPSAGGVSVSRAPSVSVPTISRGASSGNLYSPGYCTFGVKEWRPDLPNNLGDASSWYYNAQAQGMAVGSSPQIGAVAVTKAYSHVSLVIGIGDGTVTVKEMNYRGLWVVSTRTAPISEFNYIY